MDYIAIAAEKTNDVLATFIASIDEPDQPSFTMRACGGKFGIIDKTDPVPWVLDPWFTDAESKVVVQMYNDAELRNLSEVGVDYPPTWRSVATALGWK